MKNFGIEFKWGLIFTVITVLWLVFEKSMGWHDIHIAKHPIYTNLFGILAVIVYLIALKDKKKNFFGGEMTWKQGLFSGTILSIIIAILSPIVQFISSTVISPEYFHNIIEYSVESNRMTRPQAEAYFNLQSYMLQAAFGALGMGIFTSAIVAWFVRTKDS